MRICTAKSNRQRQVPCGTTRLKGQPVKEPIRNTKKKVRKREPPVLQRSRALLQQFHPDVSLEYRYF
jgi:hypothetical protein